jgi:hypothetical protein
MKYLWKNILIISIIPCFIISCSKNIAKSNLDNKTIMEISEKNIREDNLMIKENDISIIPSHKNDMENNFQINSIEDIEIILNEENTLMVGMLWSNVKDLLGTPTEIGRNNDYDLDIYRYGNNEELQVRVYRSDYQNEEPWVYNIYITSSKYVLKNGLRVGLNLEDIGTEITKSLILENITYPGLPFMIEVIISIEIDENGNITRIVIRRDTSYV